MTLIMPSKEDVIRIWKNRRKESVFWREMGDLNHMYIRDVPADGHCMYSCVLEWREVKKGTITVGLSQSCEERLEEIGRLRESTALAIVGDNDLDLAFLVPDGESSRPRTRNEVKEAATTGGCSEQDVESQRTRIHQDRVMDRPQHTNPHTCHDKAAPDTDNDAGGTNSSVCGQVCAAKCDESWKARPIRGRGGAEVCVIQGRQVGARLGFAECENACAHGVCRCVCRCECVRVSVKNCDTRNINGDHKEPTVGDMN